MQTRNDFPITLRPSDITRIIRTGRGQAYSVIRQAAAQNWFPVHRVGDAIKIPRDPFFDWYEGRPAQKAKTTRKVTFRRPRMVLRLDRGRR